MATPFKTSLLLFVSLVFSLLAMHSNADDGNVLLTGDVLGTDSQLSYAGAAFVIQGDCNLVLYNNGDGFASNTFGQGTDCTLTLNDRGQLIIKSGNGTAVWASTSPNRRGNYAAVLRPDKQVAVYGPQVWATPNLPFKPAAAGAYEAEKANIPLVRNVLFSSQVLYDNSQLATRDYTLVMQKDCNLVLNKAILGDIWDTATEGKGQNCFLRLDHRGTLTVEDDHSTAVWTSKSVSKDGDYALIMQINGLAAVYGPVLWSTSSSV